MSVTIFGILNIGFAVFGVGGLLMSRLMLHAKLPGNPLLKSMQSDPAYASWTNAVTVFGLVFALILVAAGIGLLLAQNWARILSIVYAIIDIVYVLVGAVVNYHFMQAMTGQMPGVSSGMMAVFTAVGSVFGVIFGLAYPVLLLIFMTRPKIVAFFEPEQPAAPAAG